MRYRPEIDGLRTVAVVPVIFFHADLAPFTGGFIGVDIFFVISGYLITTLLIKDLEKGRFSILDFYERRARRILPALFVVIAACTPFAYLWMFPLELNDFAQSVIATTLFSSNILFWLESGYFSADSELKPLLHSWSLAIEEQYYIFFPLLLVLFWRGQRRVLMTVVMVAVLLLVSFVLAIQLAHTAPSANFYLLPSRAWELLVGALAAIALSSLTIAPQRWFSALGLGLIIIGLFVSTEELWPSWLTLLPVVGTALIILFTSPNQPVGRMLSSAPFTFIGLISYSAYLWHQPLLAFLRLRTPQEPSAFAYMVVVIATFVLAYLTWRFIEKPFRVHRGQKPAISLKAIAVGFTSIGAIFICVGLVVDTADGLPDRIAPSGRNFVEIADTLSGGHAPQLPCDTDISFRAIHPAPLESCVFATAFSSRAPKQAILIGDSHATMISQAVRDTLQGSDYDLSVMTFGGCMPFPGVRLPGRDCNAANEAVYQHLEATHYDLIIMAARPQYTTSHEAAGVILVQSNDNPQAGEMYDLIDGGFVRLQKLDSTIVFVDPVPDMPFDVGEFVRKSYAFQTDLESLDVVLPYADYLEQAGPMLEILARHESERFVRLHAANTFCSAEGGCKGVEGGTSLYSDDNHLSRYGVARLMPALHEALTFSE